jgi:hypothetical protein
VDLRTQRDESSRVSVANREIGFLLIGLGFGLMLAIAAIVEILLSLYRSAFISAYSWDKVAALIPLLLLTVGGFLVLRRPKTEGTSN